MVSGVVRAFSIVILERRGYYIVISSFINVLNQSLSTHPHHIDLGGFQAFSLNPPYLLQHYWWYFYLDHLIRIRSVQVYSWFLFTLCFYTYVQGDRSGVFFYSSLRVINIMLVLFWFLALLRVFNSFLEQGDQLNEFFRSIYNEEEPSLLYFLKFCLFFTFW